MEELGRFLRINRNFLILLLFLSLGFLSLLFNLHQMIFPIRDFIYYLFFPTTKIASKVINFPEGSISTIKNIVYLLERNRVLEKQNKEYHILKRRYKALLQENKRIKEMLGLRERSEFRLIAANIIVRSPNWFHSITIDKGSNEGITVDTPVISVEGNRSGVIGKVIEVFPNSSKVLLITSNLSAIPAKIDGKEIDGIVIGNDSYWLEMKYLPPRKRVKIGSVVITSGIGVIFPSGIPIGEVVEVKELGIFQECKVKSAINLFGVDKVFCLVR